MGSVGTQIRAARLTAGLSLEQVSLKTCIPVKILQAIEHDNFGQMTSAFFYKSFVRQFCGQIGLAYDSLQDQIAVAAQAFPDPIMPGQGEAVLRSAVIREPQRRKKLRGLYPILSLATVLAACSGLYQYWERFHVPAPNATFAVAKAMPQKALLEDSKAVVPAEPDGRFHVELSAVERTWLSIRADGKQVYSGTLEVDQKKILEGRERGQLRTGNAGGVQIVFNGKPIGLAGPHGSVRTVVFTRDNYEVLPDRGEARLNFTPKAIAEWLLLPRVR